MTTLFFHIEIAVLIGMLLGITFLALRATYIIVHTRTVDDAVRNACDSDDLLAVIAYHKTSLDLMGCQVASEGMCTRQCPYECEYRAESNPF
jgi:MFS superfamily sulfate permease-like transporter